MDLQFRRRSPSPQAPVRPPLAGHQRKELREPIRSCLNGAGPKGSELVLDGVNRRGRPVRCQIVCTRIGEDHQARGVILLMDEAPPATEVPAGA